MKFNVGDVVICFERDLDQNQGKIGVVVANDSEDGHDRDWPILVRFDNKFNWSYTEDGFRIDETQSFNRIEHATKLHKLLLGISDDT